MVDPTGQRLSAKALGRWRRLGKRRINSHFRSAPSSREPTVLALSAHNKVNKKYPSGHFVSTLWWTLVREVRTIIQADILDNLGQKNS